MTAAIAAAAIAAGGAIAGGVISSNAAKSAAGTQANAAAANQAQLNQEYAAASGMDMRSIGQSSQYLTPYSDLGAGAAQQLSNGLTNGSLTAGFNPTMAQLQSMPGYQFQLQQGLESTQNGFAAQGLGSSGAAMKGAANYATGLAGTDVNNMANIYYQNQANAYNRLLGGTGIGQSAAGTLAGINSGMTQAGANALMGGATQSASLGMAGAQAQAAGTIGAGNAYSNALTGATNAGMQGAMAYGILGGQPTTTGSGIGTAAMGNSVLNGMYGGTAGNNGVYSGGALSQYVSGPYPGQSSNQLLG